MLEASTSIVRAARVIERCVSATAGQCDRERRALTDLRVDPDTPALRMHEVVHDVEAQTDTRTTARVRGLLEALEDVRQIPGIYADSLIGHGHEDLPFALEDRDPHRRVRRRVL